MKLEYDMHSHVLQGVDDGAKNISASQNIISALKKSGVKTLCVTPHYYTNRESLDDFISRRNEAFETLKAEAGDSINFKLGAEVYVTKYLFSNATDLTPVCYEGTRYMLTEFNYGSEFSGDTMRMLNMLSGNYGITPVLAHVERYPYLLNNLRVVEELIDMGVLIQANACSFKEFKLKFKLMKMLKNGYIQLIGSDAHSLTRNSPEAFGELSEIISKKLSSDVIKHINENSRELLGI